MNGPHGVISCALALSFALGCAADDDSALAPDELGDLGRAAHTIVGEYEASTSIRIHRPEDLAGTSKLLGFLNELAGDFPGELAARMEWQTGLPLEKPFREVIATGQITTHEDVLSGVLEAAGEFSVHTTIRISEGPTGLQLEQSNASLTNDYFVYAFDGASGPADATQHGEIVAVAEHVLEFPYGDVLVTVLDEVARDLEVNSIVGIIPTLVDCKEVGTAMALAGAGKAADWSAYCEAGLDHLKYDFEESFLVPRSRFELLLAADDLRALDDDDDAYGDAERLRGQWNGSIRATAGDKNSLLDIDATLEATAAP